jgi:hypothetical protein
MADGFLGRWSRRKLDAKDGKPLPPEPPAPAPAAAPVRPPAAPVAAAGAGAEALPAATPAPTEPPAPPPTLEDVQVLTPESDFRRFVAPDVAPEVKNAAMKKLFADPHFNVMDGLDIYIDDYGKPDPMPESMVKQLASAKFLQLFREEERKDERDGGTRESPQTDTPPSVAHSRAPEPAPAQPAADEPAPASSDADPDLRLQQDDAAPGQAPGRGTG